MGEDFTDDLQEREDALAESIAEQEAVEEGGFGASGMSYYDPDDSPKADDLTDIDYQDDSKAFTESGTGVDDFSVTNNNNSVDEQLGFDLPMGPMLNPFQNPITENYTDDWDDGEPDNFDNEEDDKSDDDEDDESEGDDEVGQGEDGFGKQKQDEESDKQGQNQTTSNSAQKQKEKYSGIINWKPGDPITLALVSRFWGEIRDISSLRPMVNAANQGVTEAIDAICGPGMFTKANGFLDKFTDPDEDMIGNLLGLCVKQGKRFTMAAGASVASIWIQQWREAVFLWALPTVLETAIRTNPLKKALNDLFKKAVPIINLKHRVKGK